MKTDVWMPLYVADLVADTLHLSRADFGSYLLLICAYWRNKGPLPDVNAQLALIARCSLEDWRGTPSDTLSVRKKLAQHFEVEGGIWKHKRIDAELEEAKK